MPKDAKSGLEPELLGRQGGRARDAKPASQSPADKLKADLESQRRKASDMAAEAEAKPRIYVVEAGDNLSAIAKKVYGDASRWGEIFEANKATVKEPNLIRVGQELVIPE